VGSIPSSGIFPANLNDTSFQQALEAEEDTCQAGDEDKTIVKAQAMFCLETPSSLPLRKQKSFPKRKKLGKTI
jgi:hypothetical protein